jgi:hypothetical protein
MIKENIERIQKRINWLKTQIAMSGYYDGWTLNGFRKELTKLIGKLSDLK